MPELPEVETIKRGIIPHCNAQLIVKVFLYEIHLRWPIPEDLADHITNQKIEAITRRSKYILFTLKNGTLIWHMGMTGTLRLVDQGTPLKKHDHVDIVLGSGKVLRFNDPRRFGALLWTEQPIETHPLFTHLGPEPLSDHLTPEHLLNKAQKRTVPIKTWLMDSKVVVGVGNIYANEVLFTTRIHPLTPVKQLTLEDCQKLVLAIQATLRAAIEAGGTTLKDFTQADGKPGYFRHNLQVYGRKGMPCVSCGGTLQELRLSGRSTVFCPTCQPRDES